MLSRMIVASVIVLIAIFAFLFSKNYEKINLRNKNEPSKITQVKKDQNYPKLISNASEPPVISARSVVVLDEATGATLFEKDPHVKHLPASTTKLMTALTALENCSPEEAILIQQVEKSGTQMGLEIGDRLTVENLISGLLIASGNDAAYALAENCAATYSDFIEEMNKKAQDLGLLNTHFVNPAGFDDNSQYSTAKDLAELARVATANPLIAQTVKTKSTVVTDVTGLRTYYLENVNKLLGVVDGVNGVKTGQTEGALEIVISKTNRNGKGLIISVLGSKDRFGESESLIEWAYSNHVWSD